MMKKSVCNEQEAVTTPVTTAVCPSAILNTLFTFITPPFSLHPSKERAKAHFPLVQSIASGGAV